MYQAGLVLEGGGMKGIYTAGIIDFFIKKNLEFANCYGVSAGACHMCNFLSKQYGRSYRVVVNYIQDKEYCGWYSLLTTGDIFGAKMGYDKIPNELDPYDYEAFERYPGNAFAVATNIVTGEPEYMKLEEMHRDIIAVRASSSLPLVSKNVMINDIPYLDGGMSDSIPIVKSIADGNRKNVVILTKDVNYRRKPSSQLKLLKLKYRKYPKLVENMEKRHLVYNETLDFLEEEEKKGNVFVIRPKKKSDVGRIEKDPKKIIRLYKEGYRDAKECYDQLIEFLSK